MDKLAQNVDTMYHLGMKTNIMQWGNSLAIRIPKSFAKDLRVDSGMEVEMTIKGSALVISKPKYDINELVEKITPENMHPETDWGAPVGKELW